MFPLHTIEGLLFRSYLTGYNLSVLHKCFKANEEDYRNSLFHKASFFRSDFDFERKIQRAKENTERYLEYCKRNDIKIIPHFDKRYPVQLLGIKDFPPLLFIKGNLSYSQCAAIVGSRQVSPLAVNKTKFIVKTFAEHNCNIISGLALGVDTMAHNAALQHNMYTAAILPTSLENIYPKENSGLAQQIIDKGGALISEQAPNYGPVANPFVLRNRIIAALSDYLFPVEMGKDSGTRYAVDYAVKYGSKVFLLKPGVDEVNHHLNHYDGIIVSIKKYRKKINVVLVRDLGEFYQFVMKDQIDRQLDLFC